MIRVQDLKKFFGQKKAVNGVSFTVEKGEVLGFLGPNGAGKSTSMRMITGFIPPTEGAVSVGGFDVVDNPLRAKRLIGYLPESAPAYSEMSVRGFLTFIAELRGLRGDAKKSAVDRVIEMCFLGSVAHQTVETLSKGYRHRTCFAQSIIHDPEVLIMDEPTEGLDPNQKHEVRTLIRKMGNVRRSFFRHTFWRKSRRFVRVPSSSIAGRLWPTERRRSSSSVRNMRAPSGCNSRTATQPSRKSCLSSRWRSGW